LENDFNGAGIAEKFHAFAANLRQMGDVALACLLYDSVMKETNGAI
jgi:hypothetical protein